MRPSERALNEYIAKLEAEVASLRALCAAQALRIDELLARLNTNSTNSSKPSSTDSPFHTKPKPPHAPSGRKPGGQTGHKPHNRQMLEPTPGEIYSCPLAQCPHCKADFAAVGRDDFAGVRACARVRGHKPQRLHAVARMGDGAASARAVERLHC